MRHLESNLQVACVTWFRLQFPDYQNLLIHVPNGGYRNKREAVNLIKQGVVRGVPDLFLAVPKKGFSGVWIEMKSEKGKLTEHQAEMIEALERVGYIALVIRSLDEFMKLVSNYLN